MDMKEREGRQGEKKETGRRTGREEGSEDEGEGRKNEEGVNERWSGGVCEGVRERRKREGEGQKEGEMESRRDNTSTVRKGMIILLL